MDSLPNTTRRTALAAALLLLVVGCTTEESSSGCNIGTIGFSNSSQSELGVGLFELKMKNSKATYTKPIPVALGKGSSFELAFKPYDDKDKDAFDYTLRSANSEMLDHPPLDNRTFTAKKAGIVAVLATSTKDPKQVLDLVHLRVLAPKKIRLGGLVTESENRALDRGHVEVPAGLSTTIDVEVVGEVDEENGPIPDATWTKGKAVGETVVLEGVPLEVSSSNEKVLTVEAQTGGDVRAKSVAPGEADVKITAGDVSRTVHVVVTKSSGGAR